MKNTRRAPRLTPAARHAQLLTCAIQRYAEQGLNGARHTDVAALAGVSVATVFHYFPTREALQGAALAAVSQRLLDNILGTQVRNPVLASTALEQVLMGFCDAIDSHPHIVRLWLHWSVASRGDLGDAYLVFYARALRGVRRLLARGRQEHCIHPAVNLKDAARVVVGLAHLIVQMKYARSTRRQVAHTVHALVQGYLVRPA